MEGWLKTSLVLCLFGFLKEMRPSEPYIFNFLIGEWRNVTDVQVTQEVYPIATYADMVLMIFVFLVTDICRYKPLIVTLGVCGMIVWGMFLWTTSLLELQIIELFYGMFMAAEVAYYTYIYAKVDKEHYQKVTSHTRGAILAGRALSGTISQTMVSMGWMNYRQLNYITFTTVSLATIWALFLPSVDKSVYFHADSSQKQESFSKKLSGAFHLMNQHFVIAYSNSYVLKWSLWWALSFCGYLQVENFMQALYSTIEGGKSSVSYNGAVEAVLTLIGFLSALLAGVLKVNWEIKGELTLAIFSLLQGALVVAMSQTTTIYICYALYIFYGVLFHFMVTIASAQVARNIDQDSYGLIFGINTFISLVIKSILTALVATKGIGFHLLPRGQYMVYGGYHVGIGTFFVVIGLRTLIVNTKKKNKNSRTPPVLDGDKPEQVVLDKLI